MGIIANRIERAAQKYKEDGNLQDLLCAIVDVGNISVNCQSHADIMYENICKHFHKPMFECLWYDGEHGSYYLLDFNPNSTKLEDVKANALECLKRNYGLDAEDIPGWEETLYLLDTNLLIRLEDK